MNEVSIKTIQIDGSLSTNSCIKQHVSFFSIHHVLLSLTQFTQVIYTTDKLNGLNGDQNIDKNHDQLPAMFHHFHTFSIVFLSCLSIYCMFNHPSQLDLLTLASVMFSFVVKVQTQHLQTWTYFTNKHMLQLFSLCTQVFQILINITTYICLLQPQFFDLYYVGWSSFLAMYTLVIITMYISLVEKRCDIVYSKYRDFKDLILLSSFFYFLYMTTKWMSFVLFMNPLKIQSKFMMLCIQPVMYHIILLYHCLMFTHHKFASIVFVVIPLLCIKTGV